MQNNKRKYKNALVTGGSRGFGRAIAVKFAKEGLDCAIVGRDKSGLAETKKLVEDHGRNCLSIVADLQKKEDVQRIGREALDYSPHWDILVNNAGVAKRIPLLEIDEKNWDLMQTVNLKSVLWLSQSIVPQMIKRKQGKIINISSMGTFFGTPGMGGYAVSKAGLNQLTRTMAVEWAKYNICVNAVCPTIVMTEMAKNIWGREENKAERESFLKGIPAGRFGSPEDVANLVYFLAGQEAEFLNGLTIPLDGGKLVNP